MVARFFSDILIYLVAILFPGWGFFVLGAIATYFFENYYEFIVVALLVDYIYGFPIPGWYGFRFVFASLAILVFVAIKIFKRKVRSF